MSLFKPNVAKLKRKRNVKGLIKALRYKKDWSVRADAARALFHMREKRAIQPLIAALGDEDSHVRGSASLTLGNWITSDDRISRRREVGMETAELLLAALRDGDWRVREGAVRALAKSDKPQVAEPLVAALSDSKEEVRQAAAEALKSPLLKLKDAVLNLLGESDSPEAIELLITNLGSGPHHWRKAAAEALVRMYHSGRIDEEGKSRILEWRSEITAPRVNRKSTVRDGHHDRSYRANGLCGVDGHTDAWDHKEVHTDTGIGVDFPL